jgi:release factor glutamine methyltransferase
MTAAIAPLASTPRVTIRDALADASTRLRDAGVATPQLDAELLLAHACGTTRTRLLTSMHDELPARAGGVFSDFAARRLRREPLAYIVGHQEFWSLDLTVTPAVLIPRPETERLVEIALAFAAAAPCVRIADVGTGSGCIAIALATELSNVEICATDASVPALAIARANATRLGVTDRVRFASGDLLTPIVDAAPFDLICSNPPYVATTDADSLQPELSYEPASALFAGNDGLAVIRCLLSQARPLLTRHGALLIEIGFGQAEAVRALAEAAGFTRVEIVDDYAGIPRVLVAR